MKSFRAVACHGHDVRFYDLDHMKGMKTSDGKMIVAFKGGVKG